MGQLKRIAGGVFLDVGPGVNLAIGEVKVRKVSKTWSVKRVGLEVYEVLEDRDTKQRNK